MSARQSASSGQRGNDIFALVAVPSPVRALPGPRRPGVMFDTGSKTLPAIGPPPQTDLAGAARQARALRHDRCGVLLAHVRRHRVWVAWAFGLHLRCERTDAGRELRSCE